MELQLIKKEMFFLLLYGVIFLALSMLMTGLFASNDYKLYVFEWMWLCFFGKCLSIIFLIKEEKNSEEEREQLLEAEISEHKQTYIPFQVYLIDALMQAANIFLICIELFYMNFGLFIICQAIVFVFYLIYSNQNDKAKYFYVACLLLSGIFSIAYDSNGNDRCYIGLIATLLQIGTNIYSITLKHQFTSQYVFQHSRYISYTGFIQFIIWIIPIIIVNYIPCPEDKKSDQIPKCSDKLNGFIDFFKSLENIYAIIVFVILILIGFPLSYLENKIRIDKLSDKMQIIEQLVLFPMQIWIFAIVKEYNKDNSQTTSDIETDTALYVLCILCFISQWLGGIYIIFKENKIEKKYFIVEDQDSELS